MGALPRRIRRRRAGLLNQRRLVHWLNLKNRCAPEIELGWNRLSIAFRTVPGTYQPNHHQITRQSLQPKRLGSSVLGRRIKSRLLPSLKCGGAITEARKWLARRVSTNLCPYREH
jgi:hypothetical protein